MPFSTSPVRHRRRITAGRRPRAAGKRVVPEDAAIGARGIAESRPLAFLSPYGCSKGAADQYVLDYAHSFGLSTVVFRMSCIYGPQQCPTSDQGWVAHFLRTALAGERLTIYGDGRQVRDVLYIDDFVAALLVARREIDRLAGQPFNMVGAGFMGGLLIQRATAAGARVTAFSQREFSLRSAREQGAVEARPLDDESAHRRTWPCVIECTGTQRGLDVASRLTGIRGRLVVAGYHQEGLREVDMQDWNWKGLNVVNAHEREPERYVHGMRAAVEAVLSRVVDPWPLFTHTVGLTDIDRAFTLMEERPDGFTKALLCL